MERPIKAIRTTTLRDTDIFIFRSEIEFYEIRKPKIEIHFKSGKIMLFNYSDNLFNDLIYGPKAPESKGEQLKIE